jgi:hypothetical protein
MFVILHVFVAISSMLYTTYLFIAPSQAKFYVSYGLVGLTIASGTYLVVSSDSRLLPACVAGLVYISAVCVAIASARVKFVRAAAADNSSK